MYIKSAALCLTGAALFGGAAAWPSGKGYVTVPGHSRSVHQHPSKRQVQEIQGALGCDAKGPLSGAWAVEIFTCQTDNNYTCQATESSGCDEGNKDEIETLKVFDSTTGEALSASVYVAEANFTCPENGLVQCAIHFANNGSASSDFGLRIANTSDIYPNATAFTNATFGSPSDNATDSANATDTTSPSDSLSSTDSGSSSSSPTDSMSSFPSDSSLNSSSTSSPSDSDFGPSSTDSGLSSSPTDGVSSTSDSSSNPTGSSSDSGSSSVPGSSASGFGSELYGDTSSSSSPVSGSSSASGASGTGGDFGSLSSDSVPTGFA